MTPSFEAEVNILLSAMVWVVTHPEDSSLGVPLALATALEGKHGTEPLIARLSTIAASGAAAVARASGLPMGSVALRLSRECPEAPLRRWLCRVMTGSPRGPVPESDIEPALGLAGVHVAACVYLVADPERRPF
jgi:hypothetical protein